MISKAEALQRLKKMGMTVLEDQSIVTVLLPTDCSFEAGLKEVSGKLRELGYESSFCVKQSKEGTKSDAMPPVKDEPATEIVEEDGQFAIDEDGQFFLGLE